MSQHRIIIIKILYNKGGSMCNKKKQSDTINGYKRQLKKDILATIFVSAVLLSLIVLVAYLLTA